MNNPVLEQDLKTLEQLFKTPEKAATKVLSFFKKTPDLSDKVRLIEQIKSTDSLRHIIALINCKHPAVRNAAHNKIAQLIEMLPSTKWVLLDVAIRSSYSRFQSSLKRGWYQLDLSQAQGLMAQNQYPQALIRIFSCHYDGYIREAAVNHMRHQPDDYFTQLLLRANDWVVKIKVLAYTNLWSCINDVDIQILSDNAILIDRLRVQSRHDHTDLLAVIDNRLRCLSNQPQLLKLITQGNHSIARSLFNVLKNADENIDAIIAAGLVAQDALVRSQAIMLAAKAQQGTVLYQTLCTALTDNVPSNRSRAIYIMLDKLPGQSSVHLHGLLLDKSSHLREAARFYLKREGVTDFADYYRQQLSVAPFKMLKLAIAGLAETGCISDWPIIEQYHLKHGDDLQMIVLEAAIKLNPAQAESLHILALKNDNATIVKQACKLQRKTRLLSIQTLYDVAQQTDHPPLKKACLTLIAYQDKWLGLVYILWFVVDKQNLRVDANTLLESWVQAFAKPYYFLLPSAKVRTQLNSAVLELQKADCEKRLVDDILRVITLVSA